MRRESPKSRDTRLQAAPVRAALRARHRRCMICGRPSSCCHEIANGPFRQKALDKPYAILVLCAGCHDQMTDKARWPVSRQLAALKLASPKDYDLDAYRKLIGRGPESITEEEVDRWWK